MNKEYFNQNMKKLLSAVLITAFSACAAVAIAQQAPEAEGDALAIAQQAWTCSLWVRVGAWNWLMSFEYSAIS